MEGRRHTHRIPRYQVQEVEGLRRREGLGMAVEGLGVALEAAPEQKMDLGAGVG